MVGASFLEWSLCFLDLELVFPFYLEKARTFATDKTMLLAFMDRDIWNLIVSQGHGHFTVLYKTFHRGPQS